MEHLTFDVLVVGSGAAGLRAAIACRQKGSEVCVISKASPGKATSTTVSGGVFAATQEGLSPENHLIRTLQAGRGINQQQNVEILVEEAPQRLKELKQWGIRADFRKGYLYAKGAPPMWGREITQCLMAKCEALGTRFIGGIVVGDLIINKAAAGVIAYVVESGEWLIIDAKALVLATGGAGALYIRHDNPQRMLGDGYVLAFEAGAVLQDLEFVQFYPLGMAEPGLPSFLIPPRLADCGRLVNGKGEEIHEKYGIQERPAAEKARDRLSQALFTETHRNGEAVWLDLRLISEDDWRKDPFSASTRKLLGDRYGAKNRPLRVAPMAHHVMGGVHIDSKGATSVAGLFAGGEVTGGLHGANRMGGNALTETLVFGKRAGEAAAEWAKNYDGVQGQHIEDRFKAILQKSAGDKTNHNPVQLTGKLRKIMWEHGGILRNEHGLRSALQKVRTIQGKAAELSLKRDPANVQRILELRFAVRTAALILQAALKRQESRGAHFREDFPNQDDETWRGHLQVKCDSEGEGIWEFKPI